MSANHSDRETLAYARAQAARFRRLARTDQAGALASAIDGLRPLEQAHPGTEGMWLAQLLLALRWLASGPSVVPGAYVAAELARGYLGWHVPGYRFWRPVDSRLLVFGPPHELTEHETALLVWRFGSWGTGCVMGWQLEARADRPRGERLEARCAGVLEYGSPIVLSSECRLADLLDLLPEWRAAGPEAPLPEAEEEEAVSGA